MCALIGNYTFRNHSAIKSISLKWRWAYSGGERWSKNFIQCPSKGTHTHTNCKSIGQYSFFNRQTNMKHRQCMKRFLFHILFCRFLFNFGGLSHAVLMCKMQASRLHKCCTNPKIEKNIKKSKDTNANKNQHFIFIPLLTEKSQRWKLKRKRFFSTMM